MVRPVLLCDPEIVGMPVVECGEPLIDLRQVPALRLDDRQADTTGAYAHLRLGVVDRLVTAQSLLPVEYRLLVVEGYRPSALQEQYFRAHVERLRRTRPDRDRRWHHRMANRYIAPPAVAPHVTGGAVDVTLCTADGKELWLGTEVNDTDTAAAALPALARELRDLLGHVLTKVGLINYPTEWWHWSYGDRYWAHQTGARTARYGPAPHPVTIPATHRPESPAVVNPPAPPAAPFGADR